MSALVRYQVVAPCFVNGSRVRPGVKPVYVMAAPGLEGTALKLAPEGAKPERTDKPAPPVMTAMPDAKIPAEKVQPARRAT